MTTSEQPSEKPSASQLRDELRTELQNRQRAVNYALYRDDPVGFITDILGERPWSIQQRIAESVRDNPNTAVPSCFGSGKDWIASRIGAWWVATGGVLFATSNSFPQLRDIFWRELRRAHTAGNLPGSPTAGNDLRWEVHETGAFAIGRKPDDRDPEAMQGIHAERVLVILDEANGIPEELFNATSGLVVNEASRRLAIGNPWEPVGPFYEACRSATWNVIPISVFDTPNFTNEPVPLKAQKELVSPFWLEERRREGLEGTPWWIAKVLGQFPDTASDQVIPLSLVEAARQREYVAEPRDFAGLDVARYGTDDSVLFTGAGNGPLSVDIVHGQSTMAVAGMAAAFMRARRGTVAVDVIGVGAGVVDRLRELKRDERIPGTVIEVNAGSKASDDLCINLRAELWWRLRLAFQANAISLARLDEKTYQRLRSELTAPTYRYTSSGRIQIESKEELKARGMASPDVADALCLWNYARGPGGGRRVSTFGAVA